MERFLPLDQAQISQLPLSSIAKNKMIAKAAAIRFDTTIANHLLSHTQLDDYYKTFIPSVNDSYLDNVEALHLFEMKRQRSLLLQKGRKILPELEGDEIGGSPFYDFNYNLINPSEIVYDSDLFSPQYPDSINYGGMGAVIGHEMFHAFDTGNLGYNANGDIGYWLDKKTEEYVRKMRVCVVEQYRSIIEKESFGSKAEFSLDENIPDIAADGPVQEKGKGYSSENVVLPHSLGPTFINPTQSPSRERPEERPPRPVIEPRKSRGSLLRPKWRACAWAAST
uniref:Peptidase_M13 domain-containing protein n=1 Tax=Bursaphelenchus xylophilus TaxID=6326 RepID=A0A1I7S2U8_BURXY